MIIGIMRTNLNTKALPAESREKNTHHLLHHSVSRWTPSSSSSPPKPKRPVTDAKEVGVGNAAEETFCHRTMPFFPDKAARRNPFIANSAPFFAGNPSPPL